MKRILEYKITNEFANFTINDFLRKIGYSRHIVTQLKKTHFGITIDNEWMYTNHILLENEVLKVIIEDQTSSENIEPVESSLDIVYEDEDIIIINKPADMPIHPSINNYNNTLANYIADYFQKQGENYVFRCINRLDKDTTGLTILAKNMLSSCILSTMAAKRAISREYLAVAEGIIDIPGTVDSPIKRLDSSVIERCIGDENDGDRAVTHYTPLKSANGHTLLSIKLETGRTHQIRVHMKHIGHPLPGDFIYNPNYAVIDRQALHSYKLEFVHPITKKHMHFTAPLPDDMKQIVKYQNL